MALHPPPRLSRLPRTPPAPPPSPAPPPNRSTSPRAPCLPEKSPPFPPPPAPPPRSPARYPAADPARHDRPRHQFGGVQRGRADDLRRRPRRVGQRPQQVEHGAHFQIDAHRMGVLHGGMDRRGEVGTLPLGVSDWRCTE